MLHRHDQKKCKGFTLTEVAIVMGIVGVVLGAIWVASSQVNGNRQAQKAAGQVLQIANNYRSLYAQHGVDAPEGDDITCLGVNADFFPADMVPPVACIKNTVGTYPLAPWSGSFVQILASQANSGVNIGYYNLPQGACNSLAIAITFSPDVIWESISGNAQFLPPLAAKVPYTTAAINGFCAAGNGNSVQVLYKAR